MIKNQQIADNNVASDVTKLLETVIDGGYCIGCGACTAINGSPLKMQLDEYGQLQATIDPLRDRALLSNSVQSVCPFSNESLNEDEISQPLFSNECKYHDIIGYILATYAGYVLEDDFRYRGSSVLRSDIFINDEFGKLHKSIIYENRQKCIKEFDR